MFDPRFLLVVLSLMSGARTRPRADPSTEQATCPADIPGVLASVRAFISDPRIRQSNGLTAVDPAKLRVLADPADAPACTQFRSTMRLQQDGAPGTRYVYYTAGGFYFVAIISVDPVTGEQLPMKGGLMIYDAALTQRGFYTF